MIDFPPMPVPTKRAENSKPVAPIVVPAEPKACPACRNIGAYAAARCGHYWRG
ncbi:MAG: hypothetical protein Q8L48_10310 [Archangium sp.]|nr:hypothetical protein [Archangium sp.]